MGNNPSLPDFQLQKEIEVESGITRSDMMCHGQDNISVRVMLSLIFIMDSLFPSLYQKEEKIKDQQYVRE